MSENSAAKRKVAFSGIQPSGIPHIGNYLGAMVNWVRMLDDYDCTFCIVDYHAMTVDYEPDAMRQRVEDSFIVNMAAGLDPERCRIFVQSHVPEVAELAWILMTCAPMGDLGRMTQFKEKSGRVDSASINAGLFTYPVLMAADVLLYKAVTIPIGDDQVQHLEFAREVTRRFNARFTPIFPEPQPLHSDVRRLMGLDGKAKMSKSLENDISLLDTPDQVWAKLRTAATDPARVRRDDPGTPEVCNVYAMHRGFSTADDQAWAAEGCRTAGIGCVDCKKRLAERMVATLLPIQDRYHELAENRGHVQEIMADGAARCRVIARETMAEVREVTGLR